MRFRKDKSSDSATPVALHESMCELDRGALIEALVRVDDRSDRAVSKTRRRVYSTVVDMEEQRKGRIKQRKTAIGMCVVIVTLLAPAVWTTCMNFSEGAHFADLQSQIPLLAMMLFPGIAAVATASYMRHHNR